MVALSNIGIIVALFFVKVGAKFLGVLPTARFLFRYSAANANYLTLMIVILTAVVPTAIVQALYRPAEEPEEMKAEVS